METLIIEMADQIHEAYLESEFHNGKYVDFRNLRRRLLQIQDKALNAGISPEQFVKLVRKTLPELINCIDLNRAA